MDKITTESLNKEAQEIQAYLEINTSEDPNELSERGSVLMAYLARTGKMLADAKQLQDYAIIDNSEKAIQSSKSLSALVLKRLIESMCCNENYTVNWIERINKTCTHQMDFIRTLLSKAKEEMRMNNFTNNTRP